MNTKKLCRILLAIGVFGCPVFADADLKFGLSNRAKITGTEFAISSRDASDLTDPKSEIYIKTVLPGQEAEFFKYVTGGKELGKNTFSYHSKGPFMQTLIAPNLWLFEQTAPATHAVAAGAEVQTILSLAELVLQINILTGECRVSISVRECASSETFKEFTGRIIPDHIYGSGITVTVQGGPTEKRILCK